MLILVLLKKTENGVTYTIFTNSGRNANQLQIYWFDSEFTTSRAQAKALMLSYLNKNSSGSTGDVIYKFENEDDILYSYTLIAITQSYEYNTNDGINEHTDGGYAWLRYPSDSESSLHKKTKLLKFFKQINRTGTSITDDEFSYADVTLTHFAAAFTNAVYDYKTKTVTLSGLDHTNDTFANQYNVFRLLCQTLYNNTVWSDDKKQKVLAL